MRRADGKSREVQTGERRSFVATRRARGKKKQRAAMDAGRYYESLSDELDALKNRVRLLIADAHWPTDGEWKESVLRSILRRTGSENVTVGRGFVVDRDECSTQIDVLVYDNTLPLLYRDGDLAFVTPSACRGIVEVKSSLTAGTYSRAVTKLADTARFVRQGSRNRPLFVGLFSYDFAEAPSLRLLRELQRSSQNDKAGVINHVALGNKTFVKFWECHPTSARTKYDSWHLYRLPNLAAGYFIHNLLADVSGNPIAKAEDSWFPTEGKEHGLFKMLSLHSGAAKRRASMPL